MRPMADPVGKLEMAQRLGVGPRTPNQWVLRGHLPKPDYPAVNGSAAWEWATVLKWAGNNGFIHSTAAAAEFAKKFKNDPVSPRGGGTIQMQTRTRSKVKPKRKTSVKRMPAKAKA